MRTRANYKQDVRRRANRIQIRAGGRPISAGWFSGFPPLCHAHPVALTLAFTLVLIQARGREKQLRTELERVGGSGKRVAQHATKLEVK